MCLIISRNSEAPILQVYVDASYGSCPDTRRSVSGIIVLFHGNITSWTAKMQTVVALSSCESEYVCLTDGVKEALYQYHLLEEICIDIPAPMMIMEDNQGAIAIAKNQKVPQRTKHIEIRAHFIRDVLQQGLATLHYCSTNNQIADLLTKPLDRLAFERLRERIFGASGGVEVHTTSVNTMIKKMMKLLVITLSGAKEVY